MAPLKFGILSLLDKTVSSLETPGNKECPDSKEQSDSNYEQHQEKSIKLKKPETPHETALSLQPPQDTSKWMQHKIDPASLYNNLVAGREPVSLSQGEMKSLTSQHSPANIPWNSNSSPRMHSPIFPSQQSVREKLLSRE